VTGYTSGGPWDVKRRTWTTLLTLPAGGHAIFGAYLRVAPSSGVQIITRFVRDPDGEDDSTGTDDRVTTRGKDFISRVWLFVPIPGKPVGIQIWHDHPGTLTVEYAQLKYAEI
jgi:hypothetical protein